MAGGTERHDVMVNALVDRLRPGARADGCRTFTGNRLLRTSGDSSYYPDFMITCAPAAHPRYETDASLIVEVLSPSTQDRDRREKAVAYVRLPSLGMLLLVDPTSPRIEVARSIEDRIAAGWDACGPGDVLSTPWGDIDLDALYRDVDAEASTTG